MGINKRYHQILMACIVAITIAAIVEIVYIQIYKLKEPVFIESYMEVALPEVKMYEREDETEVELHKDGLYYPVGQSAGVGIEPGSDKLEEKLNGDCQFELKYITNINESVQIESITLKEAPQLIACASQNQQGYSTIGWREKETGIPCGRYAVRTIYITIPGYWDEGLKELVIKNKPIELNHATISTRTNGKEVKVSNVNLGRIILISERSAESMMEMNSSDIHAGYTSKEVRQYLQERGAI